MKQLGSKDKKMLKKIVHAVLLRRRFWRFATMSEVAEIYASRMLRIAALNVVSAFVATFLYQNGVSIAEIGFMWAAMYFFKSIIALPLATVVAWIGPKHSTLVANIMYIPSMIMIALIPEHGIWLIAPAFAFQAVSTVLYTISYSVNFSKVKSMHKAGKEIATMNMIEKITAGLSPLVGGFMAFMWGLQVTIAFSAVLFLFAAVPLFRTGEPVRTRRVLKFKGFPWKMFFSQLPAHFAYGFDFPAAGVAWSLYVAVIIIGVDSNNEVYAISGMLLTIVFLVALACSYIYGRLIDRKKGWALYNAGAVVTIATHALRPFINTTIAVVGFNAVREAGHTATILPYMRATYDSADISGARSTYLGLVEMTATFAQGISSVVFGLFMLFAATSEGFYMYFFVCAAVMSLFLIAKFPLYHK